MAWLFPADSFQRNFRRPIGLKVTLNFPQRLKNKADPPGGNELSQRFLTVTVTVTVSSGRRRVPNPGLHSEVLGNQA